MKLLKLTAKNYRSLHDASIDFGDLNLFIGANASGKSTILDALRFLHEGVQTRDFRIPVYSRGGFLNLAWKGDYADYIELAVLLQEGTTKFEWVVRLVKAPVDFHVYEHVRGFPPSSPPQELLKAEKGEGEWWSGEQKAGVILKQAPTVCALAAASADASFPAREVAGFVAKWGFFDPSPFFLRRDWLGGSDSPRFDPYGRNLGETLHTLKNSSPEVLERIVMSTREVVGLPNKIEPRESEDRFYFVQEEPGLRFPVNQMGVSSGTLRMLALMTALYGDEDINLVGVEEPENYIHPAALSSFVLHLLDAQGRIQFIVTTHSPLLLDFLDDPAAISIVRRNDQGGTVVLKESNPDGVRMALEESGFGLGEYYETKGFGG
jgi:predicted ATPase